MILTEEKVSVPGNKYTVKVTSVATRRLTTIEWLLLTCINEFNVDDKMKDKSLQYAFEHVFNMRNSEFIFKPCIKNLEKIDIIRINASNDFSFGDLLFSQMTITSRGLEMLNEGLLPGESAEQSLTIYYDSLTHKMSMFDSHVENEKEYSALCERDDVVDEFPKNEIIDSLQKGDVLGKRFVASKYKIEDVEMLTTEEWTNCFLLKIISDDQNKKLYTEPMMDDNECLSKIRSMLMFKGCSDKKMTTMMPKERCNVGNILGSGKRIRTMIIDICREGQSIFIDYDIFNSIKQNGTAFQGKKVVIFNSPNFEIIEGEFQQINIKEDYPIKGCAVINNKGAQLFLCFEKYSYGENIVSVPLAYENKNQINEKVLLANWLYDLFLKYFEEDKRMCVMPFLISNNPNIRNYMNKIRYSWKDKDFDFIVNEISKIDAAFMQILGRNFIITGLEKSVIDKISLEQELRKKQITQLMGLNMIKSSGENYGAIVKELIPSMKIPQSYIDLIKVYEELFLSSHEQALYLDQCIYKLYNYNVIKDLLSNIVIGKRTRLPEYFPIDIFINQLQDDFDKVSNILLNYNLFEKMDAYQINSALNKCSNLGILSSAIDCLCAKKDEVIYGNVTLQTCLQEINQNVSRNLFDNLKMIKEGIAVIENKDLVLNEEFRRKVYIIDTCAIMHTPNILNYFEDNEYIRIPITVIDELGKIKDGRSSKYTYNLSDRARKISNQIEIALKCLNIKDKMRLVIDNAEIDLLPIDLDPTVPDNKILSVALKYAGCDVTIISDDVDFRLISHGQEIASIKSGDFIRNRVEHNIIGIQKEQKIDVDSWQDLSVKVLKKYNTSIKDNVTEYLIKNNIKTIGDFEKISLEAAEKIQANNRQIIYKNALIRAIQDKENIIRKIQAEYER